MADTVDSQHTNGIVAQDTPKTGTGASSAAVVSPNTHQEDTQAASEQESGYATHKAPTDGIQPPHIESEAINKAEAQVAINIYDTGDFLFFFFFFFFLYKHGLLVQRHGKYYFMLLRLKTI